MGKFEDYGLLAEKYFVEEQLPISRIGQKLDLTDKTLHEWKKKGNWEEKRKQFLQSQYTCYSALQELVMHLAKDTLQKVKSGEIPEAATLNFIAKMSEKLPKIKQLDELLVNEKMQDSSEENDGDTQTKIAELINQKLMGQEGN